MHCLGIIILLNLNQIHAMTYTGCIFIFPLNNTSAIVWADLCIWGYWHTSEKPKIFCIEMNFFETTCESLHMFVGSWVLWPNLKHYFKLVHATIWRNGFQPKHLINSEWRWPCLRAATWKCWTTVTKRRRMYLPLDQVSAPFLLVMITPDLIFTILSFLLIALHMETGSRYMGKIYTWEQIQFGWQNLPLIGPTWDNLPLSRK